MRRRPHFANGRPSEDLRGAIVTWKVGARDYLARVESQRYNETLSLVMLKTRHFNGEEGPEVPYGIVELLLPD